MFTFKISRESAICSSVAFLANPFMDVGIHWNKRPARKLDCRNKIIFIAVLYRNTIKFFVATRMWSCYYWRHRSSKSRIPVRRVRQSSLLPMLIEHRLMIAEQEIGTFDLLLCTLLLLDLCARCVMRCFALDIISFKKAILSLFIQRVLFVCIPRFEAL